MFQFGVMPFDGVLFGHCQVQAVSGVFASGFTSSGLAAFCLCRVVLVKELPSRPQQALQVSVLVALGFVAVGFCGCWA